MSANSLNNFSTRLCLTQLDRPDRWKQAADEFARVGVIVDPFYSFPGESPFQSFCRSQYAMLKECRDFGGNAAIFEDDVLFVEPGVIGDAVFELPADWDILYLGANITDGVPGALERPPVRHSAHLFRIGAAWTSHAICYSERAIDWIVNDYNPDSGRMFDDYLSYMLTKFNGFITAPMACWQRPGKSSLWDRDTDYSPCFAAGNLKLK